MLIGICGKSGSGKSSLARYLKEIYGEEVVHLDVDKVGHSVLLLPEVKEELINSFGESVLNGDVVDRKRLGEIVFNSRNEMKKLSDITWKYMQVEIDKFIALNGGKIIVLDWLLLSITKYFPMCDIKVLLDIPYEVRKMRAMKRDNIGEDAFDSREGASVKYDNSQFDLVLNDNSGEDLKKLVKLI